MADAKIITFGELFSPGIDVFPDNKEAAVEIEALDGNDYIKIDSTDNREAVSFVSGFPGTPGTDGGGRVNIGADESLNPTGKTRLNVIGPYATPGALGDISSNSIAGFSPYVGNADALFFAHNAATNSICLQGANTDSSQTRGLALQTYGGNVGLGTPNDAPPQERLHIADPGSEGVLLKFTTGDTGHGDTDGSFIGLDHNDNFNIANRETDRSIFFQTEGTTRGGIWYDGRAEFRSSMNVANTSTPGTDSVAIGEGASCAGDYSFTSGYGTSCAGDYSAAIGSHSNIGLGTLSHAIAIGYATQSNADYNTSIGFEVKGHNKYGVALGGANWVATKGAIQTEFIRGLVETTDDSDTELKDAGKGTGFKVLTSNTGLNKDFVMDIRIVLNSICTADGDTFVVGDFVSREYNFTGRYLYDASSPTFVLYSGNGTTYTSGTANSLRTGIRSNSSASDKLGHDTEGVVDSFVMDAAGGCGRLTLKVHPQDPNATVFHSAKIWTESTVAIAS